MPYSCIIIWTVGDHRPFKDGLPRNHTYSQIDACLLDLNTDDGPSISFIVQLKLKYLHIITPLLTRSSPDTDTQMHNFQIWHAQSRLQKTISNRWMTFQIRIGATHFLTWSCRRRLYLERGEEMRRRKRGGKERSQSEREAANCDKCVKAVSENIFGSRLWRLKQQPLVAGS